MLYLCSGYNKTNIMKRSADFYKVVNAVINTLNQGDSVAYVSGGQGGSGFGLFSPAEDFRELRMHLLDDFTSIEELDADDDELFNDWSGVEDYDSSFDFYEFSTSTSRLQVMINPDNYVNSYDLRDMISDDYDLECGEITEGMNGYPSCLRGCVLLNGGDTTIEGAQAIADLYGVQLVSLHQRDGWRLWECEGPTDELYDFARFLEEHNDNLHWWGSYKDYAEELREYADNMDEEQAQEWRELADGVDGMELGENEFLYCEQGYPYLTNPDKYSRMVDHFSYDTHNYTLALDCMIEQ